MTKQGQITKTIELENYGIKNAKVKYQLSAKELHDIAIEKGQGVEASSGALAVHTGEFTGRSPQDRFIVQDDITNDKVWWGNINIPFAPDKFEKLYNKVVEYVLEDKSKVDNTVVMDLFCGTGTIGQLIAKKTGVPLTKGGIERKVARGLLRKIFKWW